MDIYVIMYKYIVWAFPVTVRHAERPKAIDGQPTCVNAILAVPLNTY